jgi:enamine deaminase RidA (YjgF/YER057c/UK114 family)
MQFKYSHKAFDGANVNIATIEFPNGADEAHFMVSATDITATYAQQLCAVEQAISESIPQGFSVVFKRYFLSDAANQATAIKLQQPCALSIVEQPSLNGAKVSVWCYLLQDVQPAKCIDGVCEVHHGIYTHLWQGTSCFPGLNSEVATEALLSDYATHLINRGCTLADNCLRTWFFVQNVDVNYAGVVKGRNDMFRVHDLTADTHFIASTGIGGSNANRQVSVQLDTYAVKGIQQQQIKYLKAATHLNPTVEYGVSFERGTAVDYGDRRHTFISGTASINNKGEVVHEGDICLQTKRMWENVGALLAEADCDWKDVGYIIVYLRDMADYVTVNKLFEQQFPDIPRVIVLAPVCRPKWLIEMECMAVKQCNNQAYAAF